MRQSAETELKFCTQKTRQGIQFIHFKHSAYIACVVGIKREGGEGREKSAKGKKEGSWAPSPPSLPNSPPFFPSSLSPTPFDTCYAGHNIHRVRYFRRLWKSEQILSKTGSNGLCSPKKTMQIRLRVDWIYPWLMIYWNGRSQFAPLYDWGVTLESSLITFFALADIHKHPPWESRDV